MKVIDKGNFTSKDLIPFKTLIYTEDNNIGIFLDIHKKYNNGIVMYPLIYKDYLLSKDYISNYIECINKKYDFGYASMIDKIEKIEIYDDDLPNNIAKIDEFKKKRMIPNSHLTHDELCKQFKVGDTVKIVRKVEDNYKGWKNNWAYDMSRNLEKVSTIKSISSRGIYLYNLAYGYPAHSLELVSSVEETTNDDPDIIFENPLIKKGDIVVSLKDIRGYHKIGDLFKVLNHSKKGRLYYLKSTYSSEPNSWRKATEEEIELFNSGVTNIYNKEIKEIHIPKEYLDRATIFQYSETVGFNNSKKLEGEEFIQNPLILNKRTKRKSLFIIN